MPEKETNAEIEDKVAQVLKKLTNYCIIKHATDCTQTHRKT